MPPSDDLFTRTILHIFLLFHLTLVNTGLRVRQWQADVLRKYNTYDDTAYGWTCLARYGWTCDTLIMTSELFSGCIYLKKSISQVIYST